MMRENPPGCLQSRDDRRIRSDAIDFDCALGGFSRAVSRGEVEERWIAVEALVWLRDRRAITALIRALHDPIWHVRFVAVRGLSFLLPVPDWAVDPVCAAVKDAEPCVRAEAGRTLGRSVCHCAIEPLVSAVDDPTRAVRLAAVLALHDLGMSGLTSVRATNRLADLLDKDADPFVAYAAYWALGAQGGSRMDRQRANFRLSPRGQDIWTAIARV